jgi:hypothetical protein
MKFFVAIKSNPDTEAGKMPSEQLLREMTEFNEKLVKAGVMLAGEGLHPSSRGARVEFSGATGRRVIDGPFAEAKELVAGYWIFDCASLQEAIDWVKQVPNPDGDEGTVEIRQIFDAADFGAEFTPDLRERNERMAEEIAKKK